MATTAHSMLRRPDHCWQVRELHTLSMKEAHTAVSTGATWCSRRVHAAYEAPSKLQDNNNRFTRWHPCRRFLRHTHNNCQYACRNQACWLPGISDHHMHAQCHLGAVQILGKMAVLTSRTAMPAAPIRSTQTGYSCLCHGFSSCR